MPKKARDGFLPELPPSPPPVEAVAHVAESEVFEKQEQKVAAPATEPAVPDAATDKKQKLKEHLAKCREKSLAVRKEKAAVKRANKRPVGRPRKHPLPEPTPQPDAESVPEPEPVPAPSVQPATPRVAVPPPQPEMDYDRLAGLVAARMQPKAAAPAPVAPAPAVPNANDMTAFLNAYGATVRENERAKVKAERSAAAKANLDLQTKKYFSRLPKKTGGGSWDSLFDAR